MDLLRDIEPDLAEFRELKQELQEKQDKLGYDMFNLKVADEYAELEGQIQKIEKNEMKFMESFLKEYYKFYAKRPEK